MAWLYHTIYLNNGADILKSFSYMKSETDKNRFLEAQAIPYSRIQASVGRGKEWLKSQSLDLVHIPAIPLLGMQ